MHPWGQHHDEYDSRDTDVADQRTDQQSFSAQLPLLCSLCHVGGDALPWHHPDYNVDYIGPCCSYSWHRCGLAAYGTLPSSCHLLYYRLSAGLPDSIVLNGKARNRSLGLSSTL